MRTGSTNEEINPPPIPMSSSHAQDGNEEGDHPPPETNHDDEQPEMV